MSTLSHTAKRIAEQVRRSTNKKFVGKIPHCDIDALFADVGKVLPCLGSHRIERCEGGETIVDFDVHDDPGMSHRVVLRQHKARTKAHAENFTIECKAKQRPLSPATVAPAPPLPIEGCYSLPAATVPVSSEAPAGVVAPPPSPMSETMRQLCEHPIFLEGGLDHLTEDVIGEALRELPVEAVIPMEALII
mmetsp:Transcript_44282/g.108079  ORF Transcript_44282/g.108079 Transcript_44282/m.108079 type:complete len:191 (-) Transcript_44282:145-717(-)|eukprot:CAMPEP_0114128542 /NCGR_PEP_ID=MMETSP0043_2-20121206/10990_1 /TAXON_ID=464988 /ORGANISM="Hemiselmis andersenii, Strain CCMP644" /LENGTH=190 /DNA_ID=CAMNT_0001221743 /DNA_START=126 /DNA_END=698 /DNA_ORIENTATION=+